MHTSFSYWISSMALELPRSCITDSACFRSSSRFIVLYTNKTKIKRKLDTRENTPAMENLEQLQHKMLKQEFKSNLLPVKAWSDTAVLWVRLVDLRVGVKQTLHGTITVKRSHVEEHLPCVKWEEERTRGEKIRSVNGTEQETLKKKEKKKRRSCSTMSCRAQWARSGCFLSWWPVDPATVCWPLLSVYC